MTFLRRGQCHIVRLFSSSRSIRVLQPFAVSSSSINITLPNRTFPAIRQHAAFSRSFATFPPRASSTTSSSRADMPPANADAAAQRRKLDEIRQIMTARRLDA